MGRKNNLPSTPASADGQGQGKTDEKISLAIMQVLLKGRFLSCPPTN
jgi:hypothetical protein